MKDKYHNREMYWDHVYLKEFNTTVHESVIVTNSINN